MVLPLTRQAGPWRLNQVDHRVVATAISPRAPRPIGGNSTLLGARTALAVALGTAVLFPVVGLLLLGLLLTMWRLPRRWIPIVASIPWIGIFVQLNASKEISGDWSWYTNHFALLTDMPFTEYLGQRIGPFTIKITEPVYYSISYIVATVSDGRIVALSAVVTILIYAPIALALALLCSRIPMSRLGAWIATSAALLAGITFSLTTHLVRQEIAASLLVLSLSLHGTERRKLAVLTGVAAVCTHNSALVPVAAATVSVLLQRGNGIRGRPLTVLVAAALFVFAGAFYAYRVAPNPTADDGSISPLIFAIDGLLLLALLRRGGRKYSLKGTPELAMTLAVFGILIGFFLLGVASVPLALLRIYFYMESMRVLAIFLIVASLLHRRRSVPLVTPIFVAALAFFQLRLWASPFSYDMSLPAALARTWLPPL